VKEMCERAGFSGRHTNHSRKVTCATELFAHNVDEQLIMRQTGQLCCEGIQVSSAVSSAVRAYKRPGVARYVGFRNPSTPKEVQVG